MSRYEADNLSAEEPPNTIRDQDHLEELLLAGLHSSPTVRATPEFWAEREKVMRERINPGVMRRLQSRE